MKGLLAFVPLGMWLFFSFFASARGRMHAETPQPTYSPSPSVAPKPLPVSTPTLPSPSPSTFNTPQTSVEARAKIFERLNQIFFWQISDELNLSTEQEKALISVVQEIQTRRRELVKQKEGTLGVLKKIDKSSSNSSANEVLKKYESTLQQLCSLEEEEFKRLKKVLNPPTLAKFFVIREEVISKVTQAVHKHSANN